MPPRLQESSLKRKRPGQALGDADRAVLNVIKSKESLGIWARDIKQEVNVPDHQVTKSLKALVTLKLIKEVVNVNNKGRKHYMAVEFEPSKEVTGGAWYSGGSLDKEFINFLKDFCLKLIGKMKVVTTEGAYEFIMKNKVVKTEITHQQIAEILRSMVLENTILEVKSTGLAEYHDIPVGSICYRIAPGGTLGHGPKLGAMASIPCGVCPRISQCTPDGIISPSTCVYFKKWLDF